MVDGSKVGQVWVVSDLPDDTSVGPSLTGPQEQWCASLVDEAAASRCRSGPLAAGPRHRDMLLMRRANNNNNNTVDDLLFDNHRETDSKGKTIFSCLEEYLGKHVAIKNITALAADGAPAMACR